MMVMSLPTLRWAGGPKGLHSILQVLPSQRVHQYHKVSDFQRIQLGHFPQVRYLTSPWHHKAWKEKTTFNPGI